MNRFNARTHRAFARRAAALALALALLSPLSHIKAQTNMTGKVTFKIEKVYLTKAQAAEYMANKTPVWLKVSMIMRGDWVTRIDQGRFIGFGFNTFSYGIAQSAGTNQYDAPLDQNPKAYILSNELLNCSKDGISLKLEDYKYAPGTNPMPTTDVYMYDAGGVRHACPTFEYQYNPSNSVSLSGATFKDSRIKGNGDAGDGGSGDYYEIGLFYIGFLLKPGTPQTVYVRGVDVDGSHITDLEPGQAPAGTADPASTRATQINLISDGTGTTFTYGSPATTSDVTTANTNTYGGIIPGGIFIASDAEVTPLVPSAA